jgi:autotransporter-associated beta strand protein
VASFASTLAGLKKRLFMRFIPTILAAFLRAPARLGLLAALVFGVLPLSAQTPPLAFPGAVGFGANATGGHSGTVYHVTNLNASGAGSFEDAVSQSNRIIVFDVGGYIQLNGPISASSNLTIAGQTAPGGGIAIFGGETSFDGRSNIIARYVRFRDGSLDPNWVSTSATPSSHLNAVNLGTTNDTIFDHCSFEFAAYNNIDATACMNMTVQYSIFADPIDEQQFNGHFETGPLSFVANLWANSHGRNPLGKADLQFVNNVVYNYQYAMTTGNSGGVFHWDVISNYFIAGPSTTSATDDYYQVDDNQQAYALGNLLDGNKDGALNGSAANTVGSAVVLATYWFNSTYTSPTTALPTLSATSAFPVVTSIAGPYPRDQVDSQVVSQVLTLGTSGRLFGTQADTTLGNSGYGVLANSTAYAETNAAGGMADYWLNALSFNVTVDNHNTAVGAYPASYMPTTGYDAIDEYFYFLGAPHAISLENTSASPANVTVDLSTYCVGFSSSSTYSLANITNGSAVLQSNGHTVIFTPTLNFIGRANFDFTITDGSGNTLTQTLRVIVTTLPPAPPPPPAVLTWKGDGTANNWNTTSLNWVNANSTVVAYTNGSNASFDDTGSATPAVNLVGTLSPALISFNSAQNYTLTGSGILNGTMTLTLSGAGSVTLSNTGTNTFSGGVVINAGTLTLSTNTTPLGTGTLTLNGGTLNVPTAGGTTYANAIAVTGNSTLIDTSSNNLSFGGTLSGNGVLNLAISNGLTFSLGGCTTAFNGTIELGNSAGNLRYAAAAGTTGGNSSAIFDLGTSTGALTNRNGQTINLGALFGGVNTRLDGASSGNVTSTYNIGGAGLTNTFSGNIANGGGGSGATAIITKVGSGTFTLANSNNSYTGNTTVSGGTLIVNGTFAGIVQSSAGGTLSPGGINNPVTLTVAGAALSGGNYIFDLSNSPSGPNDQIVVSGNGSISTAGNNTFLINLLNGTLGAGVYNLVTCNGTLNAASGTGLLSNLPSGTRQTFVVSRPASGTAPGYIRLTVTGNPASLTWTGAGGGIWDSNTTASWFNGTGADKFFNGDSASFGDTGANTTITLTGSLSPSNVTFTNSVATPYTLTGSGNLSGTAQLVKSGNGTLTINTANTYSGGSLLNAGNVVLGSPSALGTGLVTLNGANLTLSANAVLSNAFLISAPTTITISGADTFNSSVTGSGNLTLLTASGQMLTLAGDVSSYNGTLFVQGAGTLRFNDGVNWSLANATLTLNNSVVADNRSLTDFTLLLGALAGDPGTTLTASDQSTANGVCTLQVGGLNTSTTFSGTIADSATQAIALTKVGTGNLTLGGNDTYSGDTEVAAGTLNVTGSISGGGDLDLFANTTVLVSGNISGGGDINVLTNAALTVSGNISGGGDIDIASGASLALAGASLSLDSLTIESGATLSGNGAITAPEIILNGTTSLTGNSTLNGQVILNSVSNLTGNYAINGQLILNGVTSFPSGSLTVNGTVTNNSILRLTSGALLSVSGTFTNNGILDLITSGSSLPANFVNNGTVLLASAVQQVSSFSISGSTATVQIQSYVGHNFQLQSTTTLGGAWQNIGPAQAGNGSILTFTDNAFSGPAEFYRIFVSP